MFLIGGFSRHGKAFLLFHNFQREFFNHRLGFGIYKNIGIAAFQYGVANLMHIRYYPVPKRRNGPGGSGQFKHVKVLPLGVKTAARNDKVRHKFQNFPFDFLQRIIIPVGVKKPYLKRRIFFQCCRHIKQ